MKYPLYRKNLNPKLWHMNEDGYMLDAQVRKMLLEIAKDFVTDLKNDHDVDIKIHDVVMVGSVANYNWTDYSDIDLHIVADFSELDISKDDAQTLFDSIKTSWNGKHDIKMKNHDVELYVQDIDHVTTSTAQYSVLNNKWTKEPKKEDPKFDKDLIKRKYKEYKKQINNLIQHRDEAKLKKLLKKLYQYRQAGLDTGGELSEENIVFKVLRAFGYLDKLKDSISKIYDKKMSVKEMIQEAVREVLRENAVPNDAPPKDQVHVFDFDDTLGITDNPNGIMLYKDGQPAHKDIGAALQWVRAAGLEKHLVPPRGKSSSIVMSTDPTRQGAIFYVDSSGLATVTKPGGIKPVVYDPSKGNPKIPDQGEVALIDFTPSSDVNLSTTQPIKSTVDKLKSLNSAGAKTAVMTARQGSGEARGLDGNTTSVTNEKDIQKFLASKGATPNSGIVGVKGKNKGAEIEKKFISSEDVPPKEIHFYDDSQTNTVNVSKLGGNIPSELYIYGPGHFSDGSVDPNTPNQSFAEKRSDEDDERKKT